MLGSHYYGKVLDYLLAKGYIEANENHYFVGHWSKSYRVKARYLADLLPMECRGKEIANKGEGVQCPFLGRVSFGSEGKAAFEKRLRRLKSPWRKEYYRDNFEAVCNRDWWCTIGENSGRLFSNITSLPKELRKHLLIEGEETVEIDLRNSQPFFALALYPADSQEKILYRDTVQSGQFYEKLNDWLEKPILLAQTNDRERLKKKVFQQVFFGKVTDKYPFWVAFKSIFPELAAAIEETKSVDYKQLAIRLQKTESGAIIRGVLREAVEIGLPILTVHDSVICRRRDAAKVEEMVNTHVERAVGAMPSLRVYPSANSKQHATQADAKAA